MAPFKSSLARSAGKLNPSLAQKLAKGWKQFKKGMPKLPQGAQLRRENVEYTR